MKRVLWTLYEMMKTRERRSKQAIDDVVQKKHNDVEVDKCRHENANPNESDM